MAARGRKNAILAGCDTIEHAFGLDQEQANMMVAKGLYYDPTLQRYIEPYMDDNDAKNTGGKYRIIPIFEQGGVDGGRHQGTEDHGGQRRRRRDLCAWDAGAGFRGAGEARRHDAGAGHFRAEP